MMDNAFDFVLPLSSVSAQKLTIVIIDGLGGEFFSCSPVIDLNSLLYNIY